MSKSNIEVTFTGWVATAPTFHRPDPAKPEKALSTFRVMHTPYYRDNHGNWQKGESLTVRIKVWGWAAHYVSRSIKIGDPIIASGRLIRSKWEDKDSVTHYGLELTASSLGHDLTLGESNFVRMVGALPKRGNPGSAPSDTASSLADPEGEFELSPQERLDHETGEITSEPPMQEENASAETCVSSSPQESSLDPNGEYILETTFNGQAA